jgi:hypothetical protein
MSFFCSAFVEAAHLETVHSEAGFRQTGRATQKNLHVGTVELVSPGPYLELFGRSKGGLFGE